MDLELFQLLIAALSVNIFSLNNIKQKQKIRGFRDIFSGIFKLYKSPILDTNGQRQAKYVYRREIDHD